jgi:xanthine permease XanP
VGATLVFASSLVFINGLLIITARMLDSRRIFVIGLSFMAGLSADIFPSFFSKLPAGVQMFTGSSLVLGTFTALLLNLVFRLGVRRRQSLIVDPDAVNTTEIDDFVQAQGAAWGARRDVVDRARFNLMQSVELVIESGITHSKLEVTAGFDEFNLDLRISYDGEPPELVDRRPSNEEIMASEEGQRRLAGYMLRRHADRVQVSTKAGRSTILFHFDH